MFSTWISYNAPPSHCCLCVCVTRTVGLGPQVGEEVDGDEDVGEGEGVAGDGVGATGDGVGATGAGVGATEGVVDGVDPVEPEYVLPVETGERVEKEVMKDGNNTSWLLLEVSLNVNGNFNAALGLNANIPVP